VNGTAATSNNELHTRWFRTGVGTTSYTWNEWMRSSGSGWLARLPSLPWFSRGSIPAVGRGLLQLPGQQREEIGMESGQSIRGSPRWFLQRENCSRRGRVCGRVGWPRRGQKRRRWTRIIGLGFRRHGVFAGREEPSWGKVRRGLWRAWGNARTSLSLEAASRRWPREAPRLDTQQPVCPGKKRIRFCKMALGLWGFPGKDKTGQNFNSISLFWTLLQTQKHSKLYRKNIMAFLVILEVAHTFILRFSNIWTHFK
jgi:hypothetical protein